MSEAEASSYCVKLYRNKSCPCLTRSSGLTSYQMNVGLYQADPLAVLDIMVVASSRLLNVTFVLLFSTSCDLKRVSSHNKALRDHSFVLFS